MKLKKLSFTEHMGDPEEWIMKETSFGDITLIVGKNSSGKTRLLNVISGLAGLLGGRNKPTYRDAHYKAEFESSESARYSYTLEIVEGRVVNEILFEDGSEVMRRSQSGEGVIKAVELRIDKMKFQVLENELAAATRNDKIQHPFLNGLNVWAKSLKHYKFGEPLGKDKAFAYGSESVDDVGDDVLMNQERVSEIFRHGQETYGDNLKRLIISDMNYIGYNCTDIGLYAAGDVVIHGVPASMLYIQESDLSTRTTQLKISQGMFRAFSLLIQLNYSVLSGKHTTILIDDIGEGLDYDRSSKLIERIIDIAEKNDFNIIMTSNDRFIMNKVPLDYWSVIDRKGSIVNLINKHNSPKVFDEFEYIGLNNFDFFASEYYLDQE